MTTYRERREAKAERLRGWAEKRAEKADAALEQARTMADGIPFGQPILVGHHSEGRDRNYRARITSTYDRSFEHQAKAESMAAKADSIEGALATSIYSDDPDAIEQLEARIAKLEAERTAIKAYNASCRKGSPDASLLTDKQRRDLASVMQHSAYSLGKGGQFPAYALANLSGNISQQRKRLAQLKGA